ncbi:glycosyltransferase [Acinetobacter sp. ANC 5033]|uniref:glycosyltransferase n=1 Tax=Acinetobacter amyesii TaxID=2942470 RepID=UPI00201B510F|nr:glycosyltransferase [Acinetobacter amyesii]MCL6239220.1 glycosyltransferase [Acinetobacter amyesii]
MTKKYCLYIPSLGGGGAEKVIAILASHLANKKNVEIFLIVQKLDGVYWELVNENVKIVNLDQTRTLKCLIPLAKWIRNNKPDVVFSALTHVNVVTALARKISGHKCKLILSEHSTISNLSMLKKNKYKFIFKFFYSQADYIVAVSNGVKSDISNTLNINPEKIVVINNPVYPSYLTTKKVDLNSFFKNNPGKLILSIGRLEPEKNYLNLLKAFNKFNNNHYLVILGEGSERQLLEKYIIDNNLCDRVLLPGFVKDPFVWINSADIFVSSSNIEGFGNAIVEAMAYGLNIVSTDCVGPREILSGGKYGLLIEKNKPNEFFDAINKLLDDPTLFDKKEVVNRAKDFSENIILSKYEDIFIK